MTYSKGPSWPWVQGVQASGVDVPSFNGQQILSIRARGSGHDGVSAVRAVHDDAVGAVDEFKRRYGVDLSHLLLSPQEISRRQLLSPTRRSERESKSPLIHSFVVVDNRATDGVYLEYILGTGALVDDDFRQPALAQAAEMFDRVRPSAMWTKDLLRQGRHAWELGQLLQRVQQYGALFGDEKTGLEFIRPGGEVVYFVRMLQGQAEAQQFFDRSRRGMSQHTGTIVHDRFTDVGAASPLPPGLVRLRLRSSGDGRNASILAFDSPDLLPPEGMVIQGYPSVRDAEGRLVDQVANVRWAIIELARGDKTLRQIGLELGQRRFTTIGLRQRRGYDRTYDGSSSPQDAIRTIQAHLDFYKTGSLTVRFGHKGHSDKTVSNLVPPGGWAPAADIDQAIANRDRRKEREANRALGTFSGHPVVVNGVQSRLTASPLRGVATGLDLRYRLSPSGTKAVGLGVSISHRFLTTMLIDAITNAGTAAYELVPAHRPPSSTLTRRMSAAETRIVTLEAQLLDLRSQLSQRLPSGEPAISGALLADLNANYNAASAQLDTTRRELERLEGEQLQEDRHWRSDNNSIIAAELLSMVDSLREATNQRYALRWRDCLGPLIIDVDRTNAAGHRGLKIRIQTTLSVADAPGRIQVAIDFSMDTAQVDADGRVDEAIEALRSGIPYPLQDVRQRVPLRTAVLDRLGLGRRSGCIVACTDGRIVRAAMAIMHAPEDPQDDETIASMLGEPTDFVARIRQTWTGHGHRHAWITCPREPLPGVLRELHRHKGCAALDELPQWAAELITAPGSERTRRQLHIARHGNRFEVEPCTHCGGTAFITAQITEVHRALCLSCERDRSGVQWPLSRYQLILHGYERWVEDGLVERSPLDPDVVELHPAPPTYTSKEDRKWRSSIILGVAEAEHAVFPILRSGPGAATPPDLLSDGVA